MADIVAVSTVTSEEYEDAPPPYTVNSATDQLLPETQSHDHNGKLKVAIASWDYFSHSTWLFSN